MVRDIGKTIDGDRGDPAENQEPRPQSCSTQRHQKFNSSNINNNNHPQGNQCKIQQATDTLDDFHLFDYVHHEHSYVAIKPMSTMQEIKQNDQSQSPNLTLPIKHFDDGIVAQDINSFLQQYQEFEKLASGSSNQLHSIYFFFLSCSSLENLT